MHHNALHWVNAGLRRTWLVSLATVIACAAFAARTVSSLTDASYLDSVPPKQAPLPQVVQVAPPVNKPDGAELVARNMFCSTCETPGEPGPTDSFKPNAVLIATSIGSDPRATLRVLDRDVQGSWGIGDVVPGVGRIEQIGFTSIEVADGSRRGTLSLLDGIPGGRSEASAATPAAAAAAPFSDRLRKIDDHTFEVDRSLVRDLVGGSVRTGGARISPISKNGKLEGLRLSGVRPTTIAGSLGLQNGDILEAVNNERIESANTLIGLYARLEQLNTVELAGTRRGKPLTLTLRLR